LLDPLPAAPVGPTGFAWHHGPPREIARAETLPAQTAARRYRVALRASLAKPYLLRPLSPELLDRPAAMFSRSIPSGRPWWSVALASGTAKSLRCTQAGGSLGRAGWRDDAVTNSRGARVRDRRRWTETSAGCEHMAADRARAEARTDRGLTQRSGPTTIAPPNRAAARRERRHVARQRTMDRFLLLHLSDIHLGNPKSELNARLVIGPFFEDLAAMRDAHDLEPDLIVFSGDLAHGEVPQSPLREQYGVECRAFLERLCEIFGKTLESQPLLVVPGNHDIDRSGITQSQTGWLREQEAEPTGTEAIYAAMRDNTTEWRRFIERQQAWQDFVKSLGLQDWTFHDRLNLSTGVLSTPTRRIGIAGFNTAWSAGASRDKGRLWMGRYQIEQALSDLKDADFRIAVLHHSTAWLNEAEAPEVSRLLRQHFNVLLHGHEHDYYVQDGAGRIILAAAATYQGSTRDNGYGWLSLDFHARAAEVVLREFRESDGSMWHPRIDDKTDADGRAQLLFPERTPAPHVLQPPSETPLRQIWSRLTEFRPGRALGETERVIKDLEHERFVVWEPESFERDETPPLIFWPLRLRHPTPIHAAQAFVAAALRRRGADVRLWIDDLGDPDYGVEDFRKRVEKWILACGVEPPVIRRYSDIATSGETAPGWEIVRSWWGSDVSLADVLRITKLQPPRNGAPVRARKLLTPAMTWSCLANTVSETKARTVITLGGFDERPFWATWSHARGDHDMRAGHLYIPQLSRPHRDEAVHMETDPLAWKSRSDIREFLAAEADHDGTLVTGWQHDSRPIPWCATCCVDLPLNVVGLTASGLRRAIRELDRGPNGESGGELLDLVADAVADVLFGDRLEVAAHARG
jgi:predicted MPP superfamily phosphohydrolase